MPKKGLNKVFWELLLLHIKNIKYVLRVVWLALSHLSLQPPKRLLNWIQKGQIGGQEKESESKGCEPLTWDPSVDVYMQINDLDLLNLVERHVIKDYDIVAHSVVKINIGTGYLEEVDKGATVVGAFYHLVHAQAAGSKQGDHGVCLGLD